MELALVCFVGLVVADVVRALVPRGTHRHRHDDSFEVRPLPRARSLY